MPDKLAQLKGILEIIRQDTVSAADFNVAFKALAQVIKDAISETKGVAQENKLVLLQALEALKEDKTKYSNELRKEIESFVTKNLNEIKKDNQEVLNQALEALNKISQIQVRDGIDGKDADENKIIAEVLSKIPVPKEFILDGKEIVDKVNDLPTDDEDLKIDAAHIKNLPKEVKKHTFAVQRNLAWYDESTLLIENPTKIKFAGAGVQATVDSEGAVVITVTGSAGSESNGETLTDSGDHLNYTFAHTPSSGGVRNVWLKEPGQLLTPTTDYTVSGSTLTATRVMVDGDGNPYTLIANYTY